MTPDAADRRERRVLRAAARGDPDARRRLVESYLPLVRRVAGRYRDLGLPFDDLVQEGSLGLLEAIGRFDARRGGDFATFARWRVRRAILNALTAQARIVRLPKQVVEQRRALAHVHEELTAANGHTPKLRELAAAVGSPIAAVTQVLGAPVAPLSLDRPVADGSTLESAVADAEARDPALETLADEQARLVSEALGRLSARQRRVVTRHFGFDGEPASLGEVARELHVSPQRARAIERAALHELARELASLHDQGGR